MFGGVFQLVEDWRMVTYRVVHVTQDGKPLWAVETSVSGEIPRRGRLYTMRVEAQVEADRLTDLEEKHGK
jgi:hypothetical protein